MKAEVPKRSSTEGGSTAVPTPDRSSTPEAFGGQEPSSSSGDETLHSSSASVTSKGKQKAKDVQSSDGAGEKAGDAHGGNLVGKINNLVTTDLNNITGARDFLWLGSSIFAYLNHANYY